MIKDNIKKDKVFIGYGAPAKVTTFCHVFEIGNDEIKFIVYGIALGRQGTEQEKKEMEKEFLRKNSF